MYDNNEIESRYQMFVYKTKYFGEFAANEDDKQIVIETKTNITGIEQEISIIMDIENIIDVKDYCIKILDDYKKIYEKGKMALETENKEKGSLVTYLQKIHKRYGEEMFSKLSGMKWITKRNITEIINKMDAPDIRIEIKGGKVKVNLVYEISKEVEEMIGVRMDKRYGVEGITYYE